MIEHIWEELGIFGIYVLKIFFPYNTEDYLITMLL